MEEPPTRTLEYTIHFRKGRRGKQHLVEGEAQPAPEPPPGRIPRITRLMALAIHMDGLINKGIVKNFVELARLGYVTRARITQIMSLLNLAPDIQEAILFLPRTVKGRDQIREKEVRPIAAVAHWSRQRKIWARLTAGRMK